jgi:chaperonin GroES
MNGIPSPDQMYLLALARANRTRNRKKTKMTLKPLRDQILVRRTDPSSTTEGGLIIPDTAKVKSRNGKVLAVGPGRQLRNGTTRPLDIQVGEVVYFRGTSGLEVDFDDETLVLLREDEIEGVAL